MKKIPVTKGKFALVDDKYYDELSTYRWHLGGGYARRRVKVSETKYPDRKFINMEHQIMGEGHIPYKIVVDHINRDKLDNRRSNLRFATKSENAVNSITRAKYDKESGFLGVHRHEHWNSWRAAIRRNGKVVWQMSAKDPAIVAKARQEFLSSL